MMGLMRCLALFVLIVLALVSTSEGESLVSYDGYGAILRQHVDERGMVNYRALKAERKPFDSFLLLLAEADADTYAKLPKIGKIAFWINAYNACTLRSIIDNYPIKSSWAKSLIYPKNSIRQIPGVWKKTRFTIMGRRITLDEMEHQVLRREFSEPRIHMAMVCAAMGCPSLRAEPYTGEELDSQLGDQTKKFLLNPQKFKIDHGKKIVWLSPIFKWFADDFEKQERAVLDFIADHLGEKNAGRLKRGDYSVRYLDYDWSLNEKRER